MKRSFVTVVAVMMYFIVAQAQVFTAVSESGTRYQNQTWFYSGAGKELDQSKIKSYWDKGYSLRSIDYGEGEYVALMVTYADGHKPQQSFVGSSDDVSSTIKGWWNSQKSLVYVGGCGGSQNTYASANNNSGNANNTSAGGYSVKVQANGSKRVNLPDGGF